MTNCCGSLFSASEFGCIDCLNQFIANGIYIDEKDKFGRTPLYLSALMGYTNIVQLLLDHGADKTIKSDTSNKTASEVARSIIIRNLIDDYQDLPIIKEPDCY